ncbi:hypothetical protein D3C73_936780 [compost metagenome]
MVRLHRPVFGRDGRALDQGQQVALHPLARHVGAAAAILTRGHLVDLVQEDDALVLGQQQGLLGQALLIQQLVALLGDQRSHGLGDGQLDGLGAAAAHLAQQVRQVQQADVAAARHVQTLDRRGRVGQGDLDFLVVQFAGAQLLAEGVAGGGLRAGPHQGVEDALLGLALGAGLDARAALLAHHDQGALDQVAHDLVDVAADVADLGEFGRLDLEEGRAGQPGQAPGDLCLTHARRADHQDVLGRDLVAQVVGHALAAPAVPQRHGHGALGVVLTDDEAVQFGDDFAGGKIGHLFSGEWRVTRGEEEMKAGGAYRRKGRRRGRGGLAARHSPLAAPRLSTVRFPFV